jgi:hypothetical protein
MHEEVPVQRFLTGLGGHFNVPDECKALLQMIVFELDEAGRCVDAEKIRVYDDKPKIVIKAWMEE